MSTKNDITGDTIVSKQTTDEYREGWERIFGWKSVLDSLPSTEEDVYVKTKTGEIYEVYLCPCCKSE